MLGKIKDSYLFWHDCHLSLPKVSRYSIGQQIDYLFIEIIEAITCASFLIKQEKIPYVRLAIRKMDCLKILLLVLWETKSLDQKKYLKLSEQLHEAGKMLGGWNGQLIKSLENTRDKQNSPHAK